MQQKSLQHHVLIALAGDFTKWDVLAVTDMKWWVAYHGNVIVAMFAK